MGRLNNNHRVCVCVVCVCICLCVITYRYVKEMFLFLLQSLVSRCRDCRTLSLRHMYDSLAFSVCFVSLFKEIIYYSFMYCTGCTKKTSRAGFSASWYAASMWHCFSGGDNITSRSVRACHSRGWHVHPNWRWCEYLVFLMDRLANLTCTWILCCSACVSTISCQSSAFLRVF